jgi:amino acid adenylation domain-containing protein
VSGSAGLSAEDLELMALLLEEAGIDDAGPEVIRPRPPGARVPLSFSQKRLWFLEQLEPETRIYNDVFGRRLLGALDVAALDAALHGVVRRHEALRTVFVEEAGEPVQVVLDRHPVRLDVRDLSGVPEEERMAAVRRIADEVTYAPFDLARGPLLRPTLLRLDRDDHALLLPVHHIVTDGWSQGVFWRELQALYAAAREGRPSPLPPPTLQFGDFAVWQQEHLAGGALERQLAYWKDRLRGAPTLLALPTDRPRPAEQSYRGAAHDFAVPEDASARLGALAHSAGATLFMAALAVLGALLGRYTGEDDVVVGSPIASRTRPELEDVVGLFANTLAVRVDLSGDPTFRELLGRVRDAVFEDFAHQDLPFEKIVEELRVERSLSYNPVYQVLLVHQNAPRSRAGFTGLDMHPLELEHRKSKLDLALTLFGTERGILGGWEYSTELFDRDTIVRLTDHFLVLLAAAAEDPDRRLSELPLVRPEERTRVLHAWSAGGGAEAYTAPVHALFRAQAARTPDAVAVASGDGVLTYRELSRAAGRLAHHLRARGVGPESRVGVCVERSPEMLAALLGVLGAGAAYVPLDPRSPRDRLALMLEDAGISVLLTQARLFAGLPGSAAADAVFLDADRAAIEAWPDTPPEVEVSAENAAYVVYTSGSTGRPRGVVVPHGALAGFVAAAREAYGIGAGDRVLQFASIAFDAAAEEIWPALLSGARLVLRTEEMLDSPRIFLDACRDRGITVLDLPTAYWHELAAGLADEDGDGAELPAGVRLVIIGGERALPERLRAWRERTGARVRLVNTYGPTEATVVATLADLRGGGDADAAPGHVPIGRPLGHARAYVLDARGEPAPVGVPGELYLGGGGLARGYLGDPARTAAAFVPDPFSDGAGARLYRTGDRVRWLADGTLEFIGRTDHQVKIRGFRVEPGEVEAALARQPGVEDAAVVARDDGAGQPRLVAYVVPDRAAPPTVAALRAALGAALPPYMLPAAWVTLETLPLTRNGKVDRRALPAPESVPAEREPGAAAPRSGVERDVAEAWREVLGIESVGLDDNFFDLGGHSLLLARLRSRLQGRFPREVSVVVLFRYPTVRSLSEYLGGGDAAAPAAMPAAEEVEGRRAALRRRRDLKRDAGG